MARVGIIGTGWGARVQTPNFRSAGLEVTAIAGRAAAKTERVARELAIDRFFTDWRDLVRSPEVDLVSIVTPPSLHRAMTLAALEAGKHVLCEKPTALDAAEAREMFDASRQYPDRIALIDHELRFLPAWDRAKAVVEEIGALRFAEVRYSSSSRGDRAREWNWWSDAAEGGGVLGAVASHFIDTLRYLVGEIAAVRGLLHTFIGSRPAADGQARTVTSDDFAAVGLRFENGALALLSFSVVAAIDEPTTLTIHGENGGLRLVAGSLSTVARGGEWRETVPAPPRIVGDSSGGPFGSGTLHLGRALKAALDDGKIDALAPAATFFDGLQQQRALDAARESSRNGGGWITR